MTESNSNKPNQTTSNSTPDETPKNASESHSAASNNSDSETASKQDQAAKTSTQGTSSGSSGSRKKGNKNALLHGVYSDEVILPWESKNDFEMLRGFACIQVYGRVAGYL